MDHRRGQRRRVRGHVRGGAEALVEAVLEAVASSIPVVVGIAAYGTAATIDLGRHAVANGATAVLSTAPYYMQPTPASVHRYFSEARAAVDAPLAFYNSPGGSGVDPAPADILRLVDEGALQAIKQSYPDHYHLRELKQDVGDRAAVFAGHDASAFECMIDGADGWVSTFPTVFPRRARGLGRHPSGSAHPRGLGPVGGGPAVHPLRLRPLAQGPWRAALAGGLQDRHEPHRRRRGSPRARPSISWRASTSPASRRSWTSCASPRTRRCASRVSPPPWSRPTSTTRTFVS